MLDAIEASRTNNSLHNDWENGIESEGTGKFETEAKHVGRDYVMEFN